MLVNLMVGKLTDEKHRYHIAQNIGKLLSRNILADKTLTDLLLYTAKLIS